MFIGSESALQGNVAQLSLYVGELTDESSGVRQEDNFKVEEVLFESDCLQDCAD